MARKKKNFTYSPFKRPVTITGSSNFSTTGCVDFGTRRKRGRKRAAKPSRKVSCNKKRTRKTSR